MFITIFGLFCICVLGAIILAFGFLLWNTSNTTNEKVQAGVTMAVGIVLIIVGLGVCVDTINNQPDINYLPEQTLTVTINADNQLIDCYTGSFEIYYNDKIFQLVNADGTCLTITGND